MEQTTWLHPGSALGVVAARILLLVNDAQHEVDPETASEWWRIAQEADSIVPLLEALSVGGLTQTPPFAVVAFGDDRVHVAVRGDLSVEVDGEIVTANGAATWVERSAAAKGDVVLSVAGPRVAATGFVLAGVQRAGALARRALPSASEAPPDRGEAMSASPPERGDVLPPGREPVLEPAALPEPQPEPEPEPQPEQAIPPATTADDFTQMPPADTYVADASPRDHSHPEPVREPETVDATATDGYDHLFGATVRFTVEGAAVRAHDAEQAPAAPAPPSIGVGPVPPRAQPAPVSPAVSPPPPADFGRPLISAIPGVTQSTAEPQSTTTGSAASAPEETVDVDESTVRRPVGARTSSGGPNQPTVQAIACPAGHWNPPHGDRCRTCGEPVGQADPVTVPRPVLGVLRLSTGERIALARPIVMGRAPKTPGSVSGEIAHLVTVPSPDFDVSRTHLEVRLDGWHVIVVDLESANGTLVTIPGQEPQRLRPREPFTLPVGATVTLADEVSFVYEVA